MSKNKDEKKANGKQTNAEASAPAAEKDTVKTAETAKAAEATAAKPGDEKKSEAADLPDSITITKAEFDKVKEHIDKLQKDKDDAIGAAQRVQADFDNYRRRNASLQADSMEEGVRNVIKELLPVLDNFDRALAATEGVDENYLNGIKLVHKQLMTSLTKCGLSEIEATGKFDPEFHNAVLQEEKEGAEPDEIIEVLQKGYKVKERIIRHSMVKVAK